MISPLTKRALLFLASIGSSFAAAREIEAMVNSSDSNGKSDYLQAAQEILRHHNGSVPSHSLDEVPDAKAVIQDCVKHAKDELSLADAKLTNEILNYPTPISKTDRTFRRLLSEQTRVATALFALQTELQPQTGVHS